MRYEVKIDGVVASRFAEILDALEYISNAMTRTPSLVPDITDTSVGLAFDRGSILSWCRQDIDGEEI